MKLKKSKLIIGISSRALFDLDESHEIYKKKRDSSHMRTIRLKMKIKL